jgi:hypothetical protein
LFVPSIADHDRIVGPHNLSCAPEIGITAEMALVVTFSLVSASCFVDCNRSRKRRALQRWFAMNVSLVCAALVCLLLLNSVGFVSAAKLRPWQVFPDVNPFANGKPATRSGHTMVTDEDGAVWVFGGSSGDVPTNDLFKLDVEYKQWSTITTLGLLPSARESHSMTSTYRYLWVFGGISNAERVNDLWSFSKEKLEWTQPATAGTRPSARSHHSMSSTGSNLWVYGGCNCVPVTTCALVTDVFWKLSTTTHTWTQVNPAPGPRYAHSMTSSDGFLWLFGGATMMQVDWYNDPLQSDLWKFTPGTLQWTLVPSAGGIYPNRRFNAVLTSNGGNLWLFGGQCLYSGGAYCELGVCFFDDTWSFSLVTLTWTKINPTGTNPKARVSHQIASISGNAILLFGGIVRASTTEQGQTNDVWHLSTSALAWTQLDSQSDVITRPNARMRHSMVNCRGDLWMWGQDPAWGTGGDEMWRFSASTTLSWTQIKPPIRPINRFHTSMATIGQDIWLFGGISDWNNLDTLSNELWKFSSLTLTFTLINPSGTRPSPRRFWGTCSFMVGVGSDLWVLNGAGRSGPVVSKLEEMWRFSTNSLVWEQYDAGPPWTDNGGLVISSDKQLLWAYVPYNQLWSFCLTTFKWTKFVTYGATPSSGIITIIDMDIFLWTSGSDSLFRLSLTTLTWEQLEVPTTCSVCVKRWDFAIANIGGVLWMYGGYARSAASSDLLSIDVGRRVWSWPDNGLTAFTRIFDTDVIQVTSSVAWPRLNMSAWNISLCSQPYLPCSLTITGGGTIQRSAGSSMTCQASLGCSVVTLLNVTLACDKNDVSSTRPLQISGAGTLLRMLNVTMTDCVTIGDGGSIRAMSGANVTISDSIIQHSSSSGSGGALAILGARATIYRVSFVNCTSAGAGGAVWASGLKLYPEPISPAFLQFDNCTFQNNYGSDSGGAVAITTMSLGTVENTIFTANVAGSGGALTISSSQASITGCDFSINSALVSGGAIIVSDQSAAVVQVSRFDGNRALGLGGGAAHVSASDVELIANVFVANLAPAGGGGALLWDGDKAPVVRRVCRPGFFKSNSTCSACPSYSNSPAGSTALTNCTCQAGWAGPDGGTCTACVAGKYKSPNATAVMVDGTCALCQAGKYTNVTGATTAEACMPCQAGTYSPATSGCSVTSSTACARFFALVAAQPSFSSVSTRGSAPVGSVILPVYNALGGPQGKGHVTFNRTKSQYLDAGARTLNIATNGGLTIVAVVRFTGAIGSWER